MNKTQSKSTILQELEILENFLQENPQHAIRESAVYILKRVKINIARLKTTEDKALASRFMAILNVVKPYLVSRKKCWGSGVLDGIAIKQIQWSEKQKTNYVEYDFTDIEFYDEHILANIEKYLSGKIEGTDYNKSEMSYKDRAFLNGIIRKTKPKIIVEIGLSVGGSSCVILNAMRDIENSKLYSFDYNTLWYREKETGNGRKTGFLVNAIMPEMLYKWELYTGGVPCKYFDKIPGEGIDICLIDTAHFNPGEHLNILEILPFMKKNGIVIYHDTAYHSLHDAAGTTSCISINTLNGKRILLKSEQTMGLPNIGAIILDENIEDMFFALFSNISLPWHDKIADDDFIEMFKHFSKYYPKNLVNIYVYYCYYY
ncbi:MAG: class I SAM-dependent methyltransferase, partial [Deltaproteobacteria bacterium]|nr:class I SAM-dependent methyltransferase [Deltaproteobacteria bacterium]